MTNTPLAPPRTPSPQRQRNAEPITSAEVIREVGCGLPQRRAGARDLEQGVQEREVVDRAVVTHAGHRHVGFGEVAGVGLALVAQRIDIDDVARIGPNSEAPLPGALRELQ